jgi:hypothetical protein
METAVNRVTFNNSCSANYMCLKNERLKCSDSICKCGIGQYWDGNSCGIIIFII